MRKELYYGIIECFNSDCYAMDVLQVNIMANLPEYKRTTTNTVSLPRFSSPDTATTWYDTNAISLLSAAIKHAVLEGELASAKNYTNDLFLEAGLNTPDGYGASLSFNTKSPLGDRYKWNMNVKVPINF